MQLYLNPIHAVVQLRPSMRHLESGESKKKKNVVPSNIQDTVMSEEPQERRPSRAPKKLVDFLSLTSLFHFLLRFAYLKCTYLL